MHVQSSFRANTVVARTHDAMGISDLLTAMQPAAVTVYSEGASIYAQGDSAGPLYLVEFGTVRICRLTADGRRQITAFHTAGEVFGFEAGDEHQSCAESVDGAGIRVLRSNCEGDATVNILTQALKTFARTQSQLLLLGRRTANERMAALLLDFADRQGGDFIVRLPMQRNDIADYLGLTFETVSRILRTFKDQQLIRLRSINEVEILDLRGLQQLCE